LPSSTAIPTPLLYRRLWRDQLTAVPTVTLAVHARQGWSTIAGQKAQPGIGSVHGQLAVMVVHAFDHATPVAVILSSLRTSDR
jgi:hypothetical protein